MIIHCIFQCFKSVHAQMTTSEKICCLCIAKNISCGYALQLRNMTHLTDSVNSTESTEFDQAKQHFYLKIIFVRFFYSSIEAY